MYIYIIWNYPRWEDLTSTEFNLSVSEYIPMLFTLSTLV